ncbi:hypothetical protein P20652_0038 [Pseudoalteromonas sp. BSi20652]|nr:hypothetical protein P20652_0038 [Pseudoalteromonas sp. BSi20652]
MAQRFKNLSSIIRSIGIGAHNATTNVFINNTLTRYYKYMLE